MKSQFNTKLALATAIALGLSACGEQKTLEQYLASAEQALAQQDLSSAVIHLKNAVRLEPANAKARFELGKAYLKQGNYVQAEKELERSLDLDYSPEFIISSLVQTKSKLGKSQEVYQLASDYTNLPDEAYIVVLTYAGITAVQDEDITKAEDYFAQANNLGADSLYSKIGNAYFAYANQDFQQGIELIEALAEESANSSEIVLLKAHLLFSTKQYQKSAEQFLKYRQVHPEDHSIRFFEINSLIQAGNYELAETQTDKLLELFTNSALANQYKAQVEYQQGNFNEAKSYAEQALQYGNDMILAQMIAGVSAFKLDDYEQAYNHLKPLEKYLPTDHQIKKVVMVLKIKLGYSAEAIQSLDELTGLTSDDSKILQVSGAELVRTGDLDSARLFIEQAEVLSPDDANVQAQKGYVLLSQKDLSGLKNLEQALKLNPELEEVEMSLAIQYLANEEVEKAQAIAQKWLSDDDKKISGHLLQGVILTHQNKLPEAQAQFLKVLSIDPNDIAALFNLAKINNVENNYEKAQEYLVSLLKLSPNHQGALMAYTVVNIKLEQEQQSIDFLSALQKENPDAITLRLVLAKSYKDTKQFDKGIALLEQINTESNLPTHYWISLGDFYLDVDKVSQAVQVFSQAASLYPNDVLIQLRYISMLEINGDNNLALKTASKNAEIFPRNQKFKILQSYFELISKNYSTAEKIANQLIKENASDKLLDFTLASIALHKKEYANAVELFTKLYESDHSQKNALFLARSLKFNSQQNEAEQLLESYLSDKPEDDQVRMLLSELYPATAYKLKAKHLTIISQNQPKNYIVLNNLSWNLYKQSLHDEALTAITKAYELAPNNVNVLETYGTVLVANKSFAKAIPLLEKALSNGSSDATTQISLAEALINENDFSRAKQLLGRLSGIPNDLQSKVQQLRQQVK